ncbi:MAG TPA: CHAT domain-containing protein, partial [Thermoanaerobaculia bacterium]|nr:CHAT domain-containing protein [Thermoanaerobaculia bacterium]
RLAIVADGALELLPFSALPDPGRLAEGNSEPPPLITHHEIVQLPSATVLATLREEFGSRLPALGGIAVLADPVFSATDPRVQSQAGPSVEARTPSAGEYHRLPGTRREAEEIVSLFPLSSRFEAYDFEASRETVLSGRLRGFRFIHLATHGRLDDEHPDLSGLVLSQVDRSGRRREGFLGLHEIYKLDLPADLVVLSACETGLGREVRGEGMIGLTRGFMYSGVPRLVVSLWPVEDDSTALLMVRFYRELVEGRKGPAAALRVAQLALREVPSLRDPYHWAGFVFVGDWRFPGSEEDDFQARGDEDIERRGGRPRLPPRPVLDLPGPKPRPKPGPGGER